MPSGHYTREYYDQLREGSTRSAEVIAPLVLQFLSARSVVDVGCGDGTWLSIFRRLGIEDMLGIDGDYVDPNILQIPHTNFRALDLAKPFDLGRAFDLAISLEVAEHLSPDCAATFIQSLTRLAPAVLFSAAIPLQGGLNHVNEQWPDRWAELFRERGYLPVDCIRRRIWQNQAVEWWYAQNTLLFARADLLESNAALKAELERTNLDQLRLVHPRQYLYVHGLYREAAIRADNPPPPSGLKQASRQFLVCLKNAVIWRLHRIWTREAHACEQPKPFNPGT